MRVCAECGDWFNADDYIITIKITYKPGDFSQASICSPVCCQMWTETELTRKEQKK